MFKVAIIGGKNTENYNFFKERCIYFLKKKAESGERILINTTGDDYVYNFCKQYGIDNKTYYTDWKTYKNDALKKRNEKIVAESDAMIYFDNGIKDEEMLYNAAKQKNTPIRRVLTVLNC